VRCRSENQRTALQLAILFEKYAPQLEAVEKLKAAGISIVAISFSLWRAVFLADRVHDLYDIKAFPDAYEFLQTLIRDNSITYMQDKCPGNGPSYIT
jgi:hypothetical protein